MTPVVSVVIPTFNYGHYIRPCLESLLQQRFSRFETIIVDDCSTDGTAEMLAGRLPDERFRFHRQEHNQGASVARNTGVELARGEYIVFLDADDVLLPGHLEEMVQLGVEMPSIALFCCDCQLIGSDGSLLHCGRTWHSVQCALAGYELTSGVRTLADIFHFSHCFTGYTVRRHIYRQLGGMDQGVFPLDDYDFMMRLAGQGRGVYYSDQVLARRRDHDVNCSGYRNSVKVGRKKLECLRRILAQYPELRHRGPGGHASRLSEVFQELAVSHFYEKQWAHCAAATVQCLLHDPRRCSRLAKLAARRLARSRIYSPFLVAATEA